MRSIFLAVILAMGITATTQGQSSCSVTMAQYTDVKFGITYAEAVKQLGCEGRLTNSSERLATSSGTATHKTEYYDWSGSSGGSSMSLVFQNGRLTAKNQSGLK
jgi:hypothetical protein